MLYAIFSDVHGNMDKFNRMHKILSAIQQPLRLVSLGDITGGMYNDVRALYDEIRYSGEYTAIKGNCDDGLDFTDGPIVVDRLFVACHGSPYRDNDYIRYEDDAKRAFAYLVSENVPLLFFGHTHKACLFELDKSAGKVSGVSDITAGQKIQLNRNHYYLINPGTLGKPKSYSGFCSFAIFDSTQYSVQWIRV